jgi:hemoglobin
LLRSWLAALILALILCAAPASAKDTWNTHQGKSLYERLGGLYPIAALVSDFLDRLLGDEVVGKNAKVVAALPPEKVPGLKVLVTNLMVQVTGGPKIYTGRDMKESHLGLDISAAEWDAAVAQFQASMDGQGIPSQEQKELVELLGSLRKDIVTKP